MTEVMLAQPGDISRLRSDQWAFEGKWDGNRLLVDASKEDELSLRTRAGREVSSEYVGLYQELDLLLYKHRVVVDGEVVALDEAGVPRFNEVQNHRRSRRVHFWAFDVLKVDGDDLSRLRYAERRQILETLGELTGLTVPGLIPVETGAEALAWSRERELEGVVAKRLDSRYYGKRSPLWLKGKNWLHQEVVIGGWQWGEGRRVGTIGSLLMGIPAEDETLSYVGRVGTGFSDADLAYLLDLLVPLQIEKSPFRTLVPANSVFVQPVLVGEVQYGERTHGGILRQPSWRGLRTDKTAAEVRVEGR
jgi:bifunctional non-homologous end joining protein LigD